MKLKYLIWILILIPLTFAAFEECSDTNEIEINDVPCNVITPFINNSCLNYNYTITDVNTSQIVRAWNMTPLGNGVFNFTFNQSVLGTYSIVLCDNTTSTVSVIHGTSTRYLYILILLATLALYILGKYKEDNWLLIMAGMLISVFSIYIFRNGLIELSNPFMEWVVFLILFGIGAYLMTFYGVKAIQEGWGLK